MNKARRKTPNSIHFDPNSSKNTIIALKLAVKSRSIAVILGNILGYFCMTIGTAEHYKIAEEFRSELLGH